MKAWVYSGGADDRNRTTYHRKRSRAVVRDYHLRFVPGLGQGERNPMVARVREVMHTHTTNLKQPGRRFGPSPDLDGVHEPWPRQPAKPMSGERRFDAYRRQIGSVSRLTARQYRQIGRKNR